MSELLTPLFLILLELTTQSTTSKAVVFKCPRLIEYSVEFQSGTANEMRANPGNTFSNRMIGDYGNLRKACRAIK